MRRSEDGAIPGCWPFPRSVAEFGTPALKELPDMQDTMHHPSGAGLAAPQIGVSLRVVIFGVDHNPRYPDAEEVPFTVLINPVLTPLGESVEEGWEGCLSVPGMRGLVPRWRELRYIGRGCARQSGSIERCRIFTHAWSSTRSTTWTASCIHGGSAT